MFRRVALYMFKAAGKQWELCSVYLPTSWLIRWEQHHKQQASLCLLSLRLSLCIHEMPIFGHFSMKACFAIHSFLVPNNGLQASGLSVGSSCSPDQQQWSHMEKEQGKEWKWRNYRLFSTNKGDLMEAWWEIERIRLFYSNFLFDVKIR